MRKTLFILIIVAILLAAGYIARAEVIVIENPLKPDTIEGIIKGITAILKVLAIGVGTIMIIISGVQYMTSAGDEDKAKKARQTITYTIIGVAIVIAVDFIVGLIQEILGRTG
jgi:Na+/proline symporter